ASFLRNRWYGEFYNALYNDVSSVFILLMLFILYNLFDHVSLALKQYCENVISMKWRKQMINKLMKGINPSLIEISNPDQRLCQDTQEFTSSTVILISEFCLNFFSLILFVITLFRLIDVQYGLMALGLMCGYIVFASSFISYYVKKYVLALIDKNEEYEGDLRSNTYQLHKAQHGFVELFIIKAKEIFAKLTSNQHKYYFRASISFVVRKFFDENLGIVMPHIIILIISKGILNNIGNAMQLINCLTMIKLQIMFFISDKIFANLYNAKVGYKRLKAYISEANRRNNGLIITFSTDEFKCYFPAIKIVDRLLLREVRISLERGSSLSLYGRSGLGKTTLFRNINNTIKDIYGTVEYSGLLRCICLQNIKIYLEFLTKSDVSYLSQGELQELCIETLISDRPDWIIWDEFCLGLSSTLREQAFKKLRENLPDCGIIILSQDSFNFCEHFIDLEKFK
ncbi:MAG: hypothetical protein KC414_06625, partial [Romboutsia sp.]|nr:hypothetical protein [Romboutsia sp.]